MIYPLWFHGLASFFGIGLGDRVIAGLFEELEGTSIVFLLAEEDTDVVVPLRRFEEFAKLSSSHSLGTIDLLVGQGVEFHNIFIGEELLGEEERGLPLFAAFGIGHGHTEHLALAEEVGTAMDDFLRFFQGIGTHFVDKLIFSAAEGRIDVVDEELVGGAQLLS